jgi:hypothetical protein
MVDLEDHIEESFDDELLGENVQLIDYEQLLKTSELSVAGSKIIETSYFQEVDFMRMDAIDKFLEFVFFKVQTGYMEIIHMGYPTKRMMDADLEAKIIEILNIHMIPEIIFKLLKFFTRNLNDPDTNLYIAYLIYSSEVIKSIYDTFVMFKKDIFIIEPEKRALNVKRIQQFSPRSELKLSSPLDAAARLKYILEFFAIRYHVENIYRKEDLLMFQQEAKG